MIDRSIESYSHKSWSPSRWNPFRARWPEIHELDERHTRLEERHGDSNAEIVGLAEQLRVAEQHDRDALAVWVADPSEPRPLPTAPAVEQRLGELEHEREALVTAMQRVLDEKAELVVRHRPRLRAEAAKDRGEAVANVVPLSELPADPEGKATVSVEWICRPEPVAKVVRTLERAPDGSILGSLEERF